MTIVHLVKLLFMLSFAESFIVNVNPMKMISNGSQISNVRKILRGLIRSGQFTALLGFLKHPAYDFNPIYLDVCEGFTIEIVMDVISTVQSFDDQVILLSEKCITRASSLWNDIKPEQIDLLPVNPLANSEFGPLYVQPAIFKLILQNALRTYSDRRNLPINFHNWMRDSRVKPNTYFSNTPGIAIEIVSFTNPIMFFKADRSYRHWLASLLEGHMYDLMYTSKYIDANMIWSSLLKLAIVMKSIYMCPALDDPTDIITRMNLHSIMIVYHAKLKLEKGLDCEFCSKVAEIILKLSPDAAVPPQMIDVFDILVSINEDLHPDWLIALLKCNLPASTLHYRRIVHYTAERNPHHETIEILSNLFTDDLDSFVYKELNSSFGDDKISEHPDNWMFKPLQWRFRNLRTALLPFPVQTSMEIIHGLIDYERVPYKLFRNIMSYFGDNFQQYSTSFTSILVASYDITNNLHVVNHKVFLQKALNSFLNVPELYHGNAETGIIFNPIIPKHFVEIIVNFLIHCAVLGEPTPFKIDKSYFLNSLKQDQSNLSNIYFSNADSFHMTFLKISFVMITELWFMYSNHMDNIFNKYKSIMNLNSHSVDQESRKVSISEDASTWLKHSFSDNSIALRAQIYCRFKMTQFTPSEIYYILFEK